MYCLVSTRGALCFPLHKLIVRSYAHNQNLYVDIHALAKSSIDGTPGIPHLVLTAADGESLLKHFKHLNRHPSYLRDADFTRVELANCPMPEDVPISRSWNIDLCILPQVQCLDYLKSLNGHTTVPK